MRPRPNPKPEDLGHTAQIEWKQKVSKMLYRGIKGDYIYMESKLGKRTKDMENEVRQQSLQAACKLNSDFETLQSEAASDTNRNSQTQLFHPRYQEACKTWARGDLVQCMDILRAPYFHGIMGFAHIGKPLNHSDTLQNIHTLFYPRLHAVTTATLSGNHTTNYVVGNKTHFTGIEDPIYVRADELIKFTTQPCVDKHYHNVFDTVETWKKGNFYDTVGDS